MSRGAAARLPASRTIRAAAVLKHPSSTTFRVSCLVSRVSCVSLWRAGRRCSKRSASGALLDPGTVFCTVSCMRACIRMRNGPWTRLRDVPDYILDPRPKQGCDSRPESPHQGHARGRPGAAQESVLVTRTQMSGLSRLPRRNHARTKAIAQKTRHPAARGDEAECRVPFRYRRGEASFGCAV